MIFLDQNQIEMISGGIDTHQMGITGAQVGGIIGPFVGGFVGLVLAGAGGHTGTTLGIVTLPVIGALAGFYVGTMGCGMAAYGATVAFNTVTYATSSLYNFVYG